MSGFGLAALKSEGKKIPYQSILDICIMLTPEERIKTAMEIIKTLSDCDDPDIKDQAARFKMFWG